MELSLIALLLAVTAALNLWIGIYVYRCGPRTGQNRAFGFMAFTISLWTLAVALAHYATVGHMWTTRLAFASASLFPVGVLTFIEHLPVGTVDCSKLRRWLFTPLAVAFCGLSFSPWMVVSMTPEWYGPKASYGIIHPFFAAYVVVWFVYSVYILLVKYRAATESLKLQIRYLVLAFAIPSGLATITNLGVPLFLNTSTLSRYGPFFSLLLLVLIGHAIIRHRLMDIRVVIRRSVVYLVSFGVAGVILIALLLGSNSAYHDGHPIPIREIVLALSVAVFFAPLKDRIQRAFDHYLYREPYDYQRTIRDASRALVGTIDLPTLMRYITGLVAKTLKPDSVAIYLIEASEPRFEKAVETRGGRLPDTLSPSSRLVQKVVQDRETVFRDELVEGQTGLVGADLLAECRGLGIEVIVPLVEEKQVIGLLCLGTKRSGDPYFSDDADLLTTLANQSAVAIRNAQTHQRVVQMNEELQKILGTIESGVIAITVEGKVTLFNRAAELLTGVDAASTRGRSVDRLPAPLASVIAATARDGQSRSQQEFSLPDATGQLIPLVCSTSPLLSPQGSSVGAVAVVADLSRLKELEREKQRAERLASLEALTSGVVHEIRNPLVAIKTFAQLLPIRFDDEDFRNTFSRVTERELRRIEDLLTRLRTLALASSQPLEPVNVSVALQDTLETLRPMLEQSGVRLRRLVDGTPRPILGNASQLEQLFLNLCLNAVEAMPSGGELTLRVAEVCEGSTGTLLVEISDTGCGIPEELLATIFDPFFTTKAHGTGLGLAICRSIADVHHARLSASSTLGRPGSTFMIEFPVPVGGEARVTT